MGFHRNLILHRLSFMQKIRIILRGILEKNTEFLILGPKLGQFGLFWPKNFFFKILGLLSHWTLWKLSFMQNIRKILHIVPEKKATFSILGQFGLFWPNTNFLKNLGLLNHWLLWRLSYMQNIRKILRILPEKKAKLSVSSQNSGQFGLFWPNKNFLKNLGFLSHWPLWELSFIQKIRKILRIFPEKKAKFSILGPNLGQFGLFCPKKNFLKYLCFLSH